MNVKSLFGIASLTAVVAVLAIAFILIPEKVWSPTSIGALAMFCAAIGFGMYSPYMLPSGQKGGDAASMASIGTMGFVVPGLLGWTAVTFLLSLTGLEKIVWVMMVITVAGFVISFSLLHAAAQIIDDVASINAGPSGRSVWRSQVLGMIASAKDTETKKSLEILAEKIQFGASDVAGFKVAVEGQLGDTIGKLANSVSHGADDIQATIVDISSLLDRREQELKLMRSKV